MMIGFKMAAELVDWHEMKRLKSTDTFNKLQ